MINLKTIFFSFCLIGLWSCSAIVDDSFRQTFIGDWEAFEVINPVTKDTITDPVFGFDEILGGKFCDSFTMRNDGTFEGYYQNGQITSDVVTGTWINDFSLLTITFDDDVVVVRDVDINGDIMGIQDTISVGARYIRFQKL